MTTWTRNLYEHDYLAIAKGESNDYSARNIFGYNALVGTSYIPLWENNTVYTQPTTGLNMTVTSNVADDGVIIRIIGLDGDNNVDHCGECYAKLRQYRLRNNSSSSSVSMMSLRSQWQRSERHNR